MKLEQQKSWHWVILQETFGFRTSWKNKIFDHYVHFANVIISGESWLGFQKYFCNNV